MNVKERIAQKAHDLFLRYGIRSVSMDEIASQLGISKKTIYQFYRDKNALVNSVVDMLIGNNTSECVKTREKSENPVHEVAVAVDVVKGMLKKMNPAVMYDLRKYHPAAFRKIADHKNKFLYKVIRENLDEGIRMELFRSDMDIDIIARFRLASVFMLFDADLFPTADLDLGTILEELTIHYLYGVTNAKGQRMVKKYYKRQKGDIV